MSDIESAMIVIIWGFTIGACAWVIISGVIGWLVDRWKDRNEG